MRNLVYANAQRFPVEWQSIGNDKWLAKEGQFVATLSGLTLTIYKEGEPLANRFTDYIYSVPTNTLKNIYESNNNY